MSLTQETKKMLNGTFILPNLVVHEQKYNFFFHGTLSQKVNF
jgi:hypothetical protein